MIRSGCLKVEEEENEDMFLHFSYTGHLVFKVSGTFLLSRSCVARQSKQCLGGGIKSGGCYNLFDFQRRRFFPEYQVIALLRLQVDRYRRNSFYLVRF